MNNTFYSQMKDILSEQFFAFNIWDISSAKAVIDASILERRSVFLQVSSKVFTGLDKEEFIYAVKRYAKIKGVRVVVHLDHCRDIEQIKEAVRFGWDSVMYDGSHLSIEENIRITNEVSNICRSEGILVEAEIGQVKGVEDDIKVSNGNIVDITEVARFVDATDIDMLAVAIGTAHGQYGNNKPEIDYNMIQKVREITKLPLVIHGGSELPDEVLNRLFSHNNVKKINISTDVKQSYRKGIFSALEGGLLDEGGFDATKVNTIIYNSIKELVLNKLKILEGKHNV